jgi:hypothetical protein
MYQDLFNNISNDYIFPDLPPCPDSNGPGNDVFKFLPGNQVGVVSGSTILGAMNLGDIMLNVDSWTIQTKILQPGEVTYIAGLTKGISFGTQNFLLNTDPSITYNNSFMTVDMSINYYTNFRYVSTYVHASSDYNNGISLDSALNILFGNNGINIEATYNADNNTLSFSSNLAGYYFDITRVNASTWDTPNPSDGTIYHGGILLDDPSTDLPAYKYPNGAMLGYVLKITYPNGILLSERFVEINHVTNDLTYFTPVDVSILNSFATWDPCTLFVKVPDVSILFYGASWTDVSLFKDASGLVAVDVSVFISDASWGNIIYPTISVDASSFIYPSFVVNASYYDASLNLIDVSVLVKDAAYNANIYSNITTKTIDVSIFKSQATHDSSVFFIRHNSPIDVGLNSQVNCDPANILSGGDYLDYISTYNLWEKIGLLQIWLSAEDPASSQTENLISGFYVFNPQGFPVRLDYMIIA